MLVTGASEWELHPSLLTAWLQTAFYASGQCSRARSSFHEDAGKTNELFGKMAPLELSLLLLAEPCRKEHALPGAGLDSARSDSAASSSEPVCE